MKSKDILGIVVGSSMSAGIAFGAMVFGSVLRMITTPVVAASSTAAVVASIALLVVGAKASPRVTASAALGVVLSLLPSLLFGTLWALADPLVSTGFRCGTGDMGLPFLALVLLFGGCVATIPIAFLGNLFARFLSRIALVAAVSVFVAGSAVAVVGGLSLRKPEPDAFAKLLVTTPLAPGGHVDIASTSITYDAAPHEVPAAATHESVGREAHTCTLHASRHGIANDKEIPVMSDACPPLSLHADTLTDIVIVTTTGDEVSRPTAILGDVKSYDGRQLTTSDFPGRLGAPRGWVVGDWVGALLAGLALVFAFVARRRVRDAARAIEGEHTGAGWTTLGGAPRFVPELATTSPGPVVVLSAAHDKSPTYRDDGQPHVLVAVPGSREGLRASANARVAAWAAVAIAIVAMTSAPLWVARLDGLL